MDTRTRFEVVCRHETPDRLLLDFHGHADLEERLRRHFDVATNRELLDRLGCDFHYLSCRDISQNETCLPYYRGAPLAFSDTERTCPFGIRWQRGAYDSSFAVDDALEGPLETATTAAEILAHDWPRPEWFDFEPLLAECEAQRGDKIIVGGLWSGIFGDSYRIHGYQNFLLNMALNPDLIKTLVDRMTDCYLALNDRLFSLLKGKLDVFFMGNDFGTQEALMFSRQMWQDFFFDNTRKLAALAHSYGFKTMVHSCGAIAELIPGMIDAGADILDPVQTTAAGMEPRALKRDYGDRLIFHGAVDTQQVMPYGTVEEVEEHVSFLLHTLGSDGGYLFGPSNMLGADVPVANVDRMYRLARDFRPAQS